MTSCCDNSVDYLEAPISTEQLEHLLVLQHRTLGQIATNNNYQETLNNLCEIAESMLPNSVASIMQYDTTKRYLEVIAAPHIPDEAITALNGLIPNSNSGSCGTAVFKNTPQFVCDTEIDARWSSPEFKAFSQQFGIQACWSMPIQGDNNTALGSFALSSMTKAQPSPFHKKLLQVCADIVAIVIQRKEEETKLLHLAHYDVLTQLPNRTLFLDRFNEAVSYSQHTQTMLAICFLDLDHFKPINDNFGHAIGDKLLLEVANRIQNCIREEDTVSRQGGDEFTLLFRDIESYEQCEKTIQRIHDSLEQPYMIKGIQHIISASSGITLYPIDEGDIDTLIRHADHAMYEAKQSGRNQYTLFSPELDEKIMQQQHRISEIEQALLNNELTLYYQPKVNMETGEVFGLEALIRWQHPYEGLIPPLDFLPLIEGTDLEIKVGNWVINQSLKQLSDWKKLGIEIEISINISSHHLLSDNFYHELESALEKHHAINSAHLQLEILESTALGDLQVITTILKACQNNLGLSIALDDFGTGYSSLNHLRTLPANLVKIDKNFVRDMLDDPNDYVIIDGVIGLSNSFNRQIIAEGVETTEHGLMLLAMGCKQAQGFGISKPMPAEALPKWLDEYQPNQSWLDYSAQIKTKKNDKLTLYKLVSNQWLNHFKFNTLTSPDYVEMWPIMDNRRCHCGYWIKRAHQEKLFDKKLLKRLDVAHEYFHSIAHGLLIEYQDQPFNLEKNKLKTLETAFKDMHAILGL